MTADEERRWWLAALVAYGRPMTAAIKRILFRLGLAVQRGLREDTPALALVIASRLDPLTWGRRIRLAMSNILRKASLAAGIRELRQLPGIAWRRFERRLRQRIRDFLTTFLDWPRRVIDTLRKQIIKAVGKVQRVGGDVLGRVREYFTPKALRARAGTFAESVITTGMNGAKEAARSVAFGEGSANAKVWLSMQDSRVRDSHERADGQTVPLFGLFRVGNEFARYPRDPVLSQEESAGCRCTTTVRVLTPAELERIGGRFRGAFAAT